MVARSRTRAARLVIYGRRPRAGRTLREYLMGEPDVSEVELVTAAEDALRAVRGGADVLLVDTAGLTDPHVPELLEALAHMDNKTPVLLLGVPQETVDVARAIVSGPVGILTAPPPSAAFGRAVQRVAAGASATTEELLAPYLNRLISSRRQQQADSEALSSLTNRELTVLRLLSQGQRRAEIAEELGLSPNTVRTHLANVMQKLGTHSQVTTAMRGRELLGSERPSVITLPEQAVRPPR